MDDTTRRVREQYVRFPYPDAGVEMRADGFADLLLSYVEGPAPPARLSILDAGCGTGAGLVHVAAEHPEARVVGVDLSAAALERAAARARERGVTNIELVEADLLDGPRFPTVAGGFHVVHASGVIHHLVDPERGLRALAERLAPGGALVLMVYGTHGRRPVTRLASALDHLWPDRTDLDARRAIARALLEGLGPCAVNAPPFDDAARVPESELVDRYLHAHARTYSVTEIFALLDAVGLRFVRWIEPRAWSVERLVAPGRARELLCALPDRRRYEVIDELVDHPALELIACRAADAPRMLPVGEALLEATFDWNPQAALRGTTRRLGRRVFIERTEVQVRWGPAYGLQDLEEALAHAATARMSGAALLEAARSLLPGEIDPEAGTDALAALLDKEILYLPRVPDPAGAR